jgi:glycosyltransferase involved in cell wall biosynthesis
MRKYLCIYYCWDELGNANSNQNHRQYAGLASLAKITVLYRQFSNRKYGDNMKGISSPDFLLFDRIFLKIFQSLKLVLGVDIFFWGCKMALYVKKNIKDFDVVVLTGTPYVLFGITTLLARKHKAKLVVQMYDPLLDNNYMGGINFFRSLLEKKIVRSSDLIIVHSHLMFYKMCDRYPMFLHKLKFVPFATDDVKLLPTPSLIKQDLVTLLYAGTLQRERNLDLIFKSLERIPKSEIAAIKIQLIGNVSTSIKSQIKKSPYKDVFELLPFMDKENLYDYVCKSDALLVIDSFKDNCNIFFPSKLCEYLLFKKPILLITPEISESRRLFMECPELCFNQYDEDKLAQTLQAMIKDRTLFDSRLNYSQIEQFYPSVVGKQIFESIESLF